MYFSLLPNVQYDTKPINYPFSEADYVTAKNFFRRWKVNEKIFDSSVYYKKYSIKDGERPDTIAYNLYGNAFYDWAIILTNNIINPLFNWPMSEYELRKFAEQKYDDPYRDIVRYKTISAADQRSIYGSVIIEPDMIVDEKFYNSNTTWTFPSPKVVSDLAIDLTDPTNFADISEDVAVVPSGTGTGPTGGFNIGTHLKFGSESSNPGSSSGNTTSFIRYVTLTPQNLEAFTQVRLKAIRGNDFNGGETPDASNENIYFKVFDKDGVELLSEVILDLVLADGQPETVTTYTVELPQAARIPDATMQLYQPTNSGRDFDHYGLLEFTYLIDPNFKGSPAFLDIPPYTSYNRIDDKNYLIDGVLYQYVIDEANGQERWGVKQSKGYVYYDSKLGRSREIAGRDLSYPITAFEYESEKNEESREIYLLKEQYISAFIEDFKSNRNYKTSGGFVNSRLKKAGV